MSMTVGSLFSGIGGFDLGFTRAGFQIAWQVEIDPFCRQVLHKHWPEVPKYGDIRACGSGRKHELSAIDVLIGGFPCQPHSLAGKRGASADERDLWPEFYRLIRELNPRWVVGENVSGLLSSDHNRFFGGILRDLATCGYDAEWQMLSAAAFGAPHLRNRVFFVAYPCREHRWIQQEYRQKRKDTSKPADDGSQELMAYASRQGLQGSRQERELFETTPVTPTIFERGSSPRIERSTWWATQSDVRRVAHGIPRRVDRLRGLGNAIVPQCAEYVGRCIMAYEQSREGAA